MKSLHVFELLWIFVIVHLARICARCSMDGAYHLSLKATLGNESRAARQSRLAASLMLLSNTCWSGKYESPIVWFSSYILIKMWHLVEWLAKTLVLRLQFSGSCGKNFAQFYLCFALLLWHNFTASSLKVTALQYSAVKVLWQESDMLLS